MIPVGNVTADTELTYEYGVRTEKNRPGQTQTSATATDQDEDVPKSKETGEQVCCLILTTYHMYAYIMTLCMLDDFESASM